LFFFFYETQYFGSRADVRIVDISTENSFYFANPPRAQANGAEKIRVTVLVLNGQGLGVLGKKVIIGVDPRVVISNPLDVTDSTGKATFELSSIAAGEYYIEVKIIDPAKPQDYITLPQKARLTFYDLNSPSPSPTP
jgi:hypothetical protein